MGELDLKAETVRRDLRVMHVGFARGELHLVLTAEASTDAPLVVEFKGVHSFFHRGVVGCGAVVARVVEPGSFGWHLSGEERRQHKEVHLNPKSEPTRNVFRALTRALSVRHGDQEDANFPG